MAKLLVLLLGLLGLPGCGRDDPDERFLLSLRWSLVDGRSCEDAGVRSLRVHDAGDLVTRALLPVCEAGRIGAAGAAPQRIGQVPPGERSYDVFGLSASGGVLYRGRLTVDAESHPDADVLLYFQGGE